jgi:hypothetical protein
VERRKRKKKKNQTMTKMNKLAEELQSSDDDQCGVECLENYYGTKLKGRFVQCRQRKTWLDETNRVHAGIMGNEQTLQDNEDSDKIRVSTYCSHCNGVIVRVQRLSGPVGRDDQSGNFF